MGTVCVRIAGRMKSRACSYSSRTFDRVVAPVFEKYGILGKVAAPIIDGRIYEGPISRKDALSLRKELERKCKLLGRNLTSFRYQD